MRRGVSSLLVLAMAVTAVSPAAAACKKPIFLTFDTGHMGVAPLVAGVLNSHKIKATFFLANEKTLTDGTSLDDTWAPWWKARAAEGHVFGSHTFDHFVWLADVPEGFRMKATAGPQAGRAQVLTVEQYCQELQRPADRFAAMTGQKMSHIFRAPGGKTSGKLLAMTEACGWTHVPWSSAGFSGDELSSEKFPNDKSLQRMLRDLRGGDIVLIHLGIWSRQDPWAPAVLEPLIEGLAAKGFCFATLRDHPVYGSALAR